MSDRQVRSLGIQAPGRPYFHTYEEGEVPDGQFRVDTLYTGLSAGTELTFLKGTNPYLHARWDPGLGVFVKGEPGRSYPVPVLGYMEVGRVTASRTPAVAVGDVVAMAYGHKTGHTADPAHELFVPLPPDLDLILGVYVAQMGPICANGLLHAAADLVGPGALQLSDGVRGRNVLVVGGGVVGLLTALFARYQGAAAVVVADATAERRQAAERLGLATADDSGGGAWLAVKQRWRHGPTDCGADVVFQCRGRDASLATALRSARPQGTVIDLAFYQGGASELHLGEEFHHNGLSIRCAQISRVPRGLAHLWDRQRLASETVELLRAHGSLVREHLITDVVPLDDAPALLTDLAARRRHVIQAVFEVGR